MRATGRHSDIATVTAIRTARAFRITVHRGRSDTYGLTLEETYGEDGKTLSTHVITTAPAQTGRVIDAALAAVQASGHPRSVLGFTRKASIRLDEPDGVRLALILLTTQPVIKHHRVRALVAGINTMSVEETYYWYGKCIGPDAARARRSLRTLLADD